eukprot:m.459835 g.459835  ORF g.459835 m.459835 type:complete len:319 (+) comp21842_c0_seq1:32-988(+)
MGGCGSAERDPRPDECLQTLDQLAQMITRGQSTSNKAIDELESKIQKLEEAVKAGEFRVAQTPTPGSPNPTLAKLNRKGSGASSDATTEDDGVVVRRKNKGRRSVRGEQRVSGTVFEGFTFGQPAHGSVPGQGPSSEGGGDEVPVENRPEYPEYNEYDPMASTIAKAPSNEAQGGGETMQESARVSRLQSGPVESNPLSDLGDSAPPSASAQYQDEARLFRRWSDKGSPSTMRKSSSDMTDKAFQRRTLHEASLRTALSSSTRSIPAAAEEAPTLPESAAETVPLLADQDSPVARMSTGSKSESVRVASAKAREVFAS